MDMEYSLARFLAVLQTDIVVVISEGGQLFRDLLSSHKEIQYLNLSQITEFRHIPPCAYEHMPWQKWFMVDDREHVLPGKKYLAVRDNAMPEDYFTP